MMSFVCNMTFADTFKPEIGSSFDDVNAASKKAGFLSNGELLQLNGLGGLSVTQPNPYYPLLNKFQYYMTKGDLRHPNQRADPIYVFKDSKLVLITSLNSLDSELVPFFEKQKLIDKYGSDFELANKIHSDFEVWVGKDEIVNLHTYGVKGVDDFDAIETEFKNYKELYRSNEVGALARYIVDRATAKSRNQTIAQVVQDRKTEEIKAAEEEKIAEEQRKEEQVRKEKAASMQAKKDEQAMLHAMQHISIKGVSLGQSKVPCSPKDELYSNIITKQAVRLQLECSFGSDMDKTTVIFAADGKTVVSVKRRQNLGANDPLPEAVVKTAVAHYGKPATFDEGGSEAYYGNSYLMENRKENPNGIGLRISGNVCEAGDVDERICRYLGAINKVDYELVNRPLFAKSIEDGEARLANKTKSKLRNQSF